MVYQEPLYYMYRKVHTATIYTGIQSYAYNVFLPSRENEKYVFNYSHVPIYYVLTKKYQVTLAKPGESVYCVYYTIVQHVTNYFTPELLYEWYNNYSNEGGRVTEHMTCNLTPPPLSIRFTTNPHPIESSRFWHHLYYGRMQRIRLDPGGIIGIVSAQFTQGVILLYELTTTFAW